MFSLFPSTRPKSKTGGAPQDEFLRKLVIEAAENNKNGKETTYYYCIGCDERRANNAASRALPHAVSCQPLAKDWPADFKAAKARLQNKTIDAVMSGDGELPALHDRKKRKAEDSSHQRVPIPSLEQTTIEDSFGPARISAKRQFTIDSLLLCLVVCCSLAFTLLDSGFFIDFVKALYISYSQTIQRVPKYF